MSVYSGDFLGFQLGDIHSSELSIIRTSTNNRYSENMTPMFSDTTVQVPGGDGTYYWKTFYNQQTFTIDFAFDDLHDEDIRRLKQVFSFKGVKELIFDEALYKKYMVKCSSPPIIKYVPFGEKGIKIYKGEGTINLVAFYPYGISTTEVEHNNTSSVTNYRFTNAGDINMPIKVIFPISATNIQLQLKKDNTQISSLTINSLSRIGTDTYYCIDTRTHLIEGLDSNFKKTGNLYNKYITAGDFFETPVGVYILQASSPWTKFTYNYLYY